MRTGTAGFSPVDDLLVDVSDGRVYQEGWQSWSPTGWYGVGQTSPRPELHWQQLMRFRPETAGPPTGFQAEGLLVVDPANGDPVVVFGAPDPALAVPSIRATLDGDRLVVTSNGPVTRTEVRSGANAALADFAGACAHAVAAPTPRRAPTVWCSWYHYFLEVTTDDIVENLEGMRASALPIDVVQIDDGWAAVVGDWLSLSARFSSLPDLAQRIRDSGRRAGIWVAPFTVGSDSAVAREHPDWLVGAGGTNWGQQLHGLDATHPAARDYLQSVFARLLDMGFDYFKLDFLYTGALPGRRWDDISAIAAYRSGLQLVRDVVGSAYVVGCGAPILPSVGLVDAMRVSPDVYNPTEAEPGSARLRAEPGTVARAWQQGRFWVNDADCLIARPSFPLRRRWAEVVASYSGLRGSSDRIADLDAWGLETTRRLLSTTPPPTPFPTA